MMKLYAIIKNSNFLTTEEEEEVELKLSYLIFFYFLSDFFNEFYSNQKNIFIKIFIRGLFVKFGAKFVQKFLIKEFPERW